MLQHLFFQATANPAAFIDLPVRRRKVIADQIVVGLSDAGCRAGNHDSGHSSGKNKWVRRSNRFSRFSM